MGIPQWGVGATHGGLSDLPTFHIFIVRAQCLLPLKMVVGKGGPGALWSGKERQCGPIKKSWKSCSR